jgi:rRNA maturation endonuclease Nob1
MEQVTLTRKELYDLVWAEPLSRLAKKYKISDNGLRKICKRMNIPIPPMGHWQKIQYGKRVIVTKLPTIYDGKDEITLDEKKPGDIDVDSPIAIQRRLIQTLESTKDLQLKVPDRMSSRPDKLISSTLNYYDAVRRYYKSHHGTHPDRINVLNIQVQEESRPRAFRLFGTIIKVLRSRKHDIIADHFTTYAKIGDEQVKFRLREKQRVSDIKTSYGSRQYESTGEFVFVIDIGSYTRKEVKDGHEPIEAKISTIIAMIELEGERMMIERIESEIRRKKWEEQQRIEQELRERQDKEAKAFKKLFLKAIRLHQANILRHYIKTVETNAAKKGKMTKDLKKWLTWADKKVLWYDPLVNADDPLLNDEHKTHLFKDFLKEWQ